jgi:ParB family chromosome partitioning protein
MNPPTGLFEIPPSRLEPLADQPRRYFDEQKLADLAGKIGQKGVLQPLLVRPHPSKEGFYQIVAGERRWRASQMAGLELLPCTVRALGDGEALELALMENLDREDLNPVEEVEAICRILEGRTGLNHPSLVEHLYRMRNVTRRGGAEHNIMFSPATEAITAFFGGRRQNWESFVANKLRVLDLPEPLRQAMLSGALEYTKAKELAKVDHPDTVEALLGLALEGEWSLERIRLEVKPYKKAKAKPPSFQRYLDAIGVAVAGIQDPALKARVELLFRERLAGILGEIQAMTRAVESDGSP